MNVFSRAFLQEDVSNFDDRFTSKAVSRESDEKQLDTVPTTTATTTTTKENGNDEEILFPDFDYISPEMLTGHLEEKIISLQDMRIRGYGNP